MLHFLGIGAHKCGTTWIFENLRKCAQVYIPECKEIHFWDMFYERGENWYLSLFPDNGRINGEITPAYAMLEPGMIRRIHAINPAMRLFYSLRDPRARAWSAALMRLQQENRKFEETPDAWFIAHFSSSHSQSRSDYQTCLANWLSVFPAEQLLLIDFYDISRRPHEVMNSIARHIGLPDAKFSCDLLNSKVFASPQYPLRPAIRESLVERYDTKVRSLNTYLGKPWFDPDKWE